MRGSAVVMGIGYAAAGIGICAAMGAFFAACVGDTTRAWDWWSLTTTCAGIAGGCMGIWAATS